MKFGCSLHEQGMNKGSIDVFVSILAVTSLSCRMPRLKYDVLFCRHIFRSQNGGTEHWARLRGRKLRGHRRVLIPIITATESYDQVGLSWFGELNLGSCRGMATANRRAVETIVGWYLFGN